MNVSPRRMLIVLTLVLAATAGAASAQANLYGAVTPAPNGGIPDGPSTLYTWDPSSGLLNPVGPIEFNGVNSMDSHPLTSVLYGVGMRPADGTWGS